MKVRKISMFQQLFFWLSALILLGNVGVGLVVYRHSKDGLFQQIQSNVKNISSCAAASVSGKLISSITVGQEDTQEYQTVIEELALFRDYAELEYIYTLRKTNEGIFR